MTSTASSTRVLIPFRREEALSVAEATAITGLSADTVRRWAALNDLGRMIGGRWYLSRAALRMHLDGDRRALRAYLNGDRTSELVASYLSTE